VVRRGLFRQSSALATAKSVGPSAIPSRDAFVLEVAETIKSHHGTSAESFVFGLSGRWGEGKTFFLDQLRAELRNAGYEVLDLNPWKYAEDRVAFLRSFLMRLMKTQRLRHRVIMAYRYALHRDFGDAWCELDLCCPTGIRRRIRSDVSRQSISWLRLILVGLILYWLYRFLGPSGGLSWSKLIAVVPVGLAIWLLQGLASGQVATKATTALDEFDRIARLALGLEHGKATNNDNYVEGVSRKVVVFVDDLDRVTAKVARGVLANLRTFFDKPALSFVVTGDHEVLEANLGGELAPEGSGLEEQKEQGRLFLKKVFNVYWRMPLPVRSDFEAFVNRCMESREAALKKSIPSEHDRERLRDWLCLYSGGNLRQVERMLDTVLFSLRLVAAQQEGAEDPWQQRVLRQMTAEPLLLTRVLFLQDRCMPFFELLIHDPELLYRLDVSLHDAKASGGDVSRAALTKFLEPLIQAKGSGQKLNLTDCQMAFLRDFVYEPPSFHDAGRNGKIVPSVAPWIQLACDAALEDTSGPRPEDLIRSLENQNREALAAQIAGCSATRAPEVSRALVEKLVTVADAAVRHEHVELLLSEVHETASDGLLGRALVEAISEKLGDLFAGFDDAQHVRTLLLFADVLEKHGYGSLPAAAEGVYVYRRAQDLDHVPREPLGALASSVVVGWLGAYCRQNQAQALPVLEELLPQIKRGAPMVEEQLTALLGEVCSHLLSDGDGARRDARLRILTNHGPDQLPVAKSSVLAATNKEQVWVWALASAEAGVAPWTAQELEDALIDEVAAAVQDPKPLLKRLLYTVGKLDGRSGDLWSTLQEKRDDGLLGLVEKLTGTPQLGVLVIPETVAAALYSRLADEVLRVTQTDEGRALQMAQFLNPSLWLWREVDRRAAHRALGPLADKRYRSRRQLQKVVGPFKDQLA